jgi:hypothetical protein
MQRIGLLMAALVLTVLAHFTLPLPPTDSLRNTLVLLPLIVAALAGVGMWARPAAGRQTPRAIVLGELTLLALVVLLTLAHQHLGLASDRIVERCLAGALVLLLMHRVAWLVIALRHTLGSELPEWPPIPFFALPFVVYMAILPWSAAQRPPDGDAPHYLLLTHSLAYDFDTDLRNNYEEGDSLEFMDRRLEAQPGDPVGRHGELFSRHNMLLPLMLAPIYRVKGLFGALIIMGALTAVTSWLALALAYHYFRGPVGPAVFAWAALAFTVPLLLFSYQIWVEVPAALLVLLALIQINRLRSHRPPSRWIWLNLTIAVALLPLLKIRFMFIAAPLALLALWHGDRKARKGAILILTCVLLLAPATLLFNQLVFQNPLKYHDIDGLKTYMQSPAKYLRGSLGLFFDCAFGLFASAPIWMLLLPALLVVVWLRHRIVVDTFAVFLPYFLLLLPRGEWFGAWSPPYRYGVVLLPVLALWLIPLLRGKLRTGGRVVIAVLAALTIVLTTLWIVVPGWTYNIADGRSHVLDHLSAQTSADVARFFPSSIRPRAATYIWPVVTFIVVTSIWRLGRRRSNQTAVMLGVAVSLLIPPILIAASEHRTTQIVEFEDPWLSPEGGKIYPDLWVVYRPQYRGGWLLPTGSSIRAPLVAGSDHLDLEIDLLSRPKNRPGAILEVLDDTGRVLARREITASSQWTSLIFENLPLPEDDELRLRVRSSGEEARKGHHVVLDRARIKWR